VIVIVIVMACLTVHKFPSTQNDSGDEGVGPSSSSWSITDRSSRNQVHEEVQSVAQRASGNNFPINSALLKETRRLGYAKQSYVWREILKSGQQLMSEAKDHNGGKDVPAFVAVEVGANTLTDAMEMSHYGFETHTFEPSPLSFSRMKGRLSRISTDKPEIARKIFIYNYAVGDTDGGEILFDNSGSTGAAVVSKEEAAKSHRPIARVKTATLDSFFAGNVEPDVKLQPPSSDIGGEIFAAKIDVQGFEPKVFEGMKKTVFERKIHFLLTEHDPMALDEVNGFAEKCTESLNHLQMLHGAGYRIYGLKLETHPKFEKAYNQGLKSLEVQRGRPFDDAMKDCLNMYRIQDEYYEEPDYKFHIWTDFLAVSPDAPWPEKSDFLINRIEKGRRSNNSSV